MKKYLFIFIIILIFLNSVGFAEKMKPKGSIDINLVGDILLDGTIKKYIEKEGTEYPWKEAKTYLKKEDLNVGNLECSVTNKGTKWKDKQFNFRMDPKDLQGIKDANIELVTLANNHVMDYGYDGLLDTFKYLDSYGIKYTGAGRTKKEAMNGVVIEKNGVKVGIVAFSRVIPDVKWYATDRRAGIISAYEPYVNEMYRKIKDMKEKADIVILSIHWGIERNDIPRKNEISIARKAIDSGADIIMGHHPHVLQGIEIYKGKPIFYSLGNFVFNSQDKLSTKTMIGQVKIVDKKVSEAEVIPMKIIKSRPISVTEKERLETTNYLNNISKNFNTKILKDGTVEYLKKVGISHKFQFISL